eukprot:SAG22_NODE_6704_length_821_cov_1.789474_1_plen_94_part_10
MLEVRRQDIEGHGHEGDRYGAVLIEIGATLGILLVFQNYGKLTRPGGNHMMSPESYGSTPSFVIHDILYRYKNAFKYGKCRKRKQNQNVPKSAS